MIKNSEWYWYKIRENYRAPHKIEEQKFRGAWARKCIFNRENKMNASGSGVARRLQQRIFLKTVFFSVMGPIFRKL